MINNEYGNRLDGVVLLLTGTDAASGVLGPKNGPAVQKQKSKGLSLPLEYGHHALLLNLNTFTVETAMNNNYGRQLKAIRLNFRKYNGIFLLGKHTFVLFKKGSWMFIARILFSSLSQTLTLESPSGPRTQDTFFGLLCRLAKLQDFGSICSEKVHNRHSELSPVIRRR